MNIIQVYKQFPTQDDCIKHIEKVRWNGTPTCPYCGAINSSVVPNERRYHCNSCNTSYSATVKTIFHHTHIPLQKWFVAISMILNAKRGIASRQLARDIDVNKNTAWRIQMQIREAMTEYKELLEGIVEMDETYVGGKPRKGDGEEHKRGRGSDKTPVVGIVERDGNVKATVHEKTQLKYENLRELVDRFVDKDKSTLMTDDYRGYSPMSKIIKHKTINHSTKQYADGDIHTNTIESFWSIIKRAIIGQYYHITSKHLKKYIDEFCFKWNNRKNPSVMFDLLIANGVRAA